MLELEVALSEGYDEARSEFIAIESVKFQLEHSLLAVSEWESKWEIPFFDDQKQKTSEQTLDYIKCMTVTEGVPEVVYEKLTDAHITKISEYIAAKRTATWFSEEKTITQRAIVTSELIYYWMVALTIPFECETWHINRLLTLIRVCNEKNNQDGKKKLSGSELAARNRELNAARRKQLNSKG